MEQRDEIGFEVATLSRQIKHALDENVLGDENTPLTGMQGWIIGYLYNNRDKDIFQRDLQNHFSVRRSTVTGILQLMEKNGLIRRSSVDFDARLKKLELTPKAMQMQENVMANFRRMEQLLCAILTPEEKDEFLRLCRKIKAGIGSGGPDEKP